MPTSSSAPGDPNNWVQRPPSTFVKIVNTSREAINGQFGVVLHYAADRGRYVVHLVVTQEQVSLKPENLLKASTMEQMRAQWQLLKNDPNVHRQMQQVYTSIQQRTGLKPEYVGVGVLLLLLLTFYIVGFSKTVMLLSIFLILITLLGPDLAAGATWQTALSHLPSRTRTLIRENVPVLGPTIANNNYMTAALVGLILAIMAKTLFSTPAKPAMAAATNAAAAAVSSSSSRQDMEYYYKLGFDDATAVKPFGASLPDESPNKHLDDLDDWTTSANLPPLLPQKKSPWNFSTLMSLFVVGRTVYELGKDAATGQWNASQAMANLRTLEVWKMGLLAFSVYRIVSAFM